MKTYEEIFEDNSEETLVSAVRNGMNVYLRNYCSEYDYETFFEAAVKYGTPALVNACIDMGADVNCVAPIKARVTRPRAETSSLVAAMRAFNPGTLRTLLERGARTGVLNGLLWDIQRNVIPEAENDEEAQEIKQCLDAGTEILKILRDAGFKVPGLDRDDDKMSFCSVSCSSFCDCDSDAGKGEEIAGEKYTAWEDWDGEYADGGDDDENKSDRYCEGEKLIDSYPDAANPYHGTRPGALWHAASPEALRLMIESGADVNAQDAAGWTTLHHIAYYHDDEYYFNPNTMLQILLDSGADINARGRYGVTPLMSAAMNYGSYCWNAETFSFLLKSGADFHALDDRGNGVWYWMTWYWCGDDHKLDKFTYQEILFELYRSVQSEKAKAEGLEETSGSTSLTADKDGRALISNKCGEVGEAVKFLIANGAHPGLMRLERSKENAHRMTDDLQKLRLKPGRLFKGVFSENSAGAIANAVRNGLDLSLEDEDGESFLEAAMRYGASEVVQACVDRGINVNKYEDCTVAYKRVCPLHTAIKAYNADAVEVLLKAGVDLETVNEVPWHEQINIFPEGIDGNEEAKELKRRLDAGAKILRMLHEAGARVPTAGGAELTYVHFGYSDNREFRSLQHYILRKRYQKQKKGVDYEEAVMVLRRAASPKALKLLIDAGTDINARDHTGCTAMHRLADDWGRYFDSCAMLKVLIDAGANVNARDDEGLTPLKLLASYAITHPHALEAIKYLVMAGADIEAKGNTSSVYYWLETSMINTSWKNPLLRNLFDAIVEIFGSKNQKKDEGFARRKADLDLMTVACWGGAVEIESALSRGADVNARSEYGYTPLMFAAAFNTKDAVQFLIGKGADINARGKGKSETALILACMRDWRDHRRSCTTDVVRALIEAGADVNACDDCGNTPLLLVARACDADELAVILIEAGADINAKNKYGNTALKEAMCSFMRYYFHHLKVARALFAAGADPRCFFDDECEDKEQEDEDIGNVDDEESDESDFQVCLRQFGLKV